MVQMAEPAVRQEKSVLVAVSDVPESLSLAVPQDSTLLRLAKLFLEEPDALIGHVRVCGGSGRATARFYPASSGVNGAALANRGALLPQRRSPFFFLSALERDTGVYATGIEALENFYAFILPP